MDGVFRAVFFAYGRQPLPDSPVLEMANDAFAILYRPINVAVEAAIHAIVRDTEAAEGSGNVRDRVVSATAQRANPRSAAKVAGIVDAADVVRAVNSAVFSAVFDEATAP